MRVECETPARRMRRATRVSRYRFHNFLDGAARGESTGFCLEAQHFPDSPNHTAFQTATLKPGAEYKSKIVIKFSAQ